MGNVVRLTGTPDYQNVFSLANIEYSYGYSNNLSNGIWINEAGMILTSGGTDGTGVYQHLYNAAPNGLSHSEYGTMDNLVHAPLMNAVMFKQAGRGGVITSSNLRVADVDYTTGTLLNIRTVTFEDDYLPGGYLLSSSADSFIFINSTEIRFYQLDSIGGSTLLFIKAVELSSAPMNIGGYGGTFAYDGKYFYFSDANTGTTNQSYSVYDGDTGVKIGSYSTGSTALASTYFDWSVGRYSQHDGYGNFDNNTSIPNRYLDTLGDSHAFSKESTAHSFEMKEGLLIQAGTIIKTFVSGDWQDIGSAPATDQMFKDYAMSSTSSITAEQWKAIPSDSKILAYTETNKVFTADVTVHNLYDSNVKSYHGTGIIETEMEELNPHRKYLIVNADQEGCTFKYSLNNGSTWTSFTLGDVIDISAVAGTQLKIQINLPTDSAKLTAISYAWA
jgi:hypothetical protein